MAYYFRGPETLRLTREGIIENIDVCFACGAGLANFVYWHGHTGIALHASCAERLGWDLIKDAATLRLEMKKPYGVDRRGQ